MKISKGTLMVEILTAHPDLFQCPKCTQPLHLESFSLRCRNRHSYDLSKKGYIHLLLKKDPSIYSKELFEARNRCAQRGVFQPLTRKIGELMESHSLPWNEIAVLDAGCGEGSLTRQLAAREALHGSLFCGIDISKEGILQAAREPSSILWTVGDLAQLPYQNESFHWILNILSPANYKEFARVLKPGGIILKVVPGARYLQSIRDVVYRGTQGQTYDNAKIKEHFQRNVTGMEIYPLSYTLTPDEDTLRDLLDMTPLLLDKIPNEKQWAELKKIQTWSLDYEILLGKMN